MLDSTYNISNQVNKIVEMRNRIIDARSGLHKKIPINKWVRFNYSSILIPKPDTNFFLKPGLRPDIILFFF